MGKFNEMLTANSTQIKAARAKIVKVFPRPFLSKER